MCELALQQGAKAVFVHAFLDGRDTPPKSADHYLAQFTSAIDGLNEKYLGKVYLVSLVGRYYAMDRDKRWERVKVAYDALVSGIGERSSDMVEAVQKSYDEGVTDEFIKPFVRIDENGQPVGMIRPNDVVVFFNYRNDRAKELTVVLTQEDMPAEGMHTMPLYYCCMTPYDAKFTGLHILFDKENVPDTIGEWVSKQGLKQLRIAETEKYAHVTFFLNGGIEEPKEGEERVLVASPKVATYDLQPEMSAPEVTEKLVAAINEDRADFYIVNFANCDMVGHTGVFDAAVKAVEAVDDALSKVVPAILAKGGFALITADHGNADHMFDVASDGSKHPFTAHTTNRVPFIIVDEKAQLTGIEDGRLSDIAPTMLTMAGIEPSAEMTGRVLATEA